MRITFWSCGVLSGVDRSETVPTCPATRGSFLRLHIRFPECWDGRRLDSPDHKSHMAYAVRGEAARRRTPSRCRRSRRSTAIRPAAGKASRSHRAASSRGHADFLNAWRPTALRTLVDDCLNALVHCGRGKRRIGKGRAALGPFPMASSERRRLPSTWSIIAAPTANSLRTTLAKRLASDRWARRRRARVIAPAV